MRLLSLMMSFLLMAVALSYCLEATQKVSEKQAEVKCKAEGHDVGSENYQKCVKEGAKPISQRAVEMKNQAQDIRKSLDGMNDNIRKNLQMNQ